jgi:ketosteroid isomerase-like protein
MSKENVEIVRGVHRAFNGRDVEAIVAVWDEQAEFMPVMSALEGAVYLGHEGLRRWMQEVDEDWDVFEAHGDEYRDLGDAVLALGRWHARGRASGIVLDVQTAAWLVRLRDGKVVWYRTFSDRAEAFEAAGL